jgi:hypothetical protein
VNCQYRTPRHVGIIALQYFYGNAKGIDLYTIFGCGGGLAAE